MLYLGDLISMADKYVKDVIEARIEAIVVDSEYTVGLSNREYENEDFQAILDIFECERTEKNADWRSDIFIPEFFSLITTQASTDASQYFANRDFVESYVMDGTKTNESDADERLINRTLNQKHLHLYHKYMRLKLYNYFKGECYARFWWEKKFKPIKRIDKRVKYSDTEDIYGNPLQDVRTQTPRVIEEEIEVEDREIIYDRFNFDVYDPRNVVTDNGYAYSLQDKDYVILRSDITLDELQGQEEDFGYFNLDKLEKVISNTETDTSKETFNKNQMHTIPSERR